MNKNPDVSFCAIQADMALEHVNRSMKEVQHDDTQLIPPGAINEIDNLLVHVWKGCLSDIEHSGGKSQTEEFIES